MTKNVKRGRKQKNKKNSIKHRPQDKVVTAMQSFLVFKEVKSAAIGCYKLYMTKVLGKVKSIVISILPLKRFELGL